MQEASLGQSTQETVVTSNHSKTEPERDRSSLVSLALTFVVFVALPYELYVLGFSLVNDFALTVFAAGLLTDIFTTKAGFNRGYGDYNVFYNATKKRIRNNSFLIGVAIFGAVRAYLIYFFWQDTFILLLVAMISLIGPLWNSVVLSVPDNRPPGAKQYENIASEEAPLIPGTQ